jgi:hypothetical protein
MDLTAVVRSYVERMLRDVSGMKVLLLDAETTKIVSTVYSQSEILEQEASLVRTWPCYVEETSSHCTLSRCTKLS